MQADNSQQKLVKSKKPSAGAPRGRKRSTADAGGRSDIRILQPGQARTHGMSAAHAGSAVPQSSGQNVTIHTG